MPEHGRQTRASWRRCAIRLVVNVQRWSGPSQVGDLGSEAFALHVVEVKLIQLGQRRELSRKRSEWISIKVELRNGLR